MKSTLLGIAAMLVLGVAFVAETHAGPSRQADERRFKELDINRNSLLSEEEFIGTRAGKARAKAKKEFKTLDTNRDDSLSFREFTRAA